jgi:flavin reductase (DIM6/NTAB) family NADH-FMN oxidoreductase RutF
MSNPDIFAKSFRESMSRVAGAVHVIATDGPGGLSGATVTAMTSVSDSPPSLLVCLNATSRTLAAIRLNGVFAVNVLSAAQQNIADIFAGQSALEGDARFAADLGWSRNGSPVLSSPVLKGALAHFSCRVADMTPVGSHIILIGTVIDTQASGDDAGALLYFRRGYKTL